MNPVHYSSKSNEWATPQDLFDRLNAEFHFALDAAATNENAKCELFYSERTNALAQDWTEFVKHGAVFCNPPYGRELWRWVVKCTYAAQQGLTVVCLIPARPDTKYWAEWIWDHERHAPRPGVEVRFLKGRVKFGGAKAGAPFPSAVVVFRPHRRADV